MTENPTEILQLEGFSGVLTENAPKIRQALDCDCKFPQNLVMNSSYVGIPYMGWNSQEYSKSHIWDDHIYIYMVVSHMGCTYGHPIYGTFFEALE